MEQNEIYPAWKKGNPWVLLSLAACMSFLDCAPVDLNGHALCTCTSPIISINNMLT